MAATGMPEPDEPKGRVLRFRPRGGSPLRGYFSHAAPRHESPVESLAKYERTDDTDDYRHRMVMNALATLVVVVLIAAGVWIASTMAEMRKNQDCFLQGRKNCTPIDITQPNRR